MNNKKIILLFILLFGMKLFAETPDKFKINIGAMFVTDFSTNVGAKKQTRPAFNNIDWNKDLDLKNDTSAFRLDGYYRFNDRHSIDFAYYSVKSEGHKNSTKSFEYEDILVGVGANVNTYFNMDVYKVSYGYTFYHTENLELMLSAGLHITDIEIGLSASGNISVVAGGNAASVSGNVYKNDESVTMPLPVFGFKGAYSFFDKKLYSIFKTEYFQLKYDDYDGSVVVASLALEYRFTENYGAGIGYNINKINLDYKPADKELKVSNEFSGVMVYLTYIY